MEFEWSEEKRLWTLNDRGLEFRDAYRLFDGRPTYTYASPRADEARFVTVGILERKCIAVVWMDRLDIRRVISMRRVRRGEERTLRTLHD